MKINASTSIVVDIDPVNAVQEIQNKWKSKLQDVHDKEAYLKDGHWYTEDRFGQDKGRKATAEEKEIERSFNTIITHLKAKK